MKKKYVQPKITKVVLDIKQCLIAGCKKNARPASGNANRRCNQTCISALGT